MYFFYHILFMQSLITFYSFITSLRVLESLSMFSPSFCLAHCFRLHNSVFYITGTERKSHLKWGLDNWRWDNIFFFPKSLYKLKFYLAQQITLYTQDQHSFIGKIWVILYLINTRCFCFRGLILFEFSCCHMSIWRNFILDIRLICDIFFIHLEWWLRFKGNKQLNGSRYFSTLFLMQVINPIESDKNSFELTINIA